MNKNELFKYILDPCLSFKQFKTNKSLMFYGYVTTVQVSTVVFEMVDGFYSLESVILDGGPEYSIDSMQDEIQQRIYDFFYSYLYEKPVFNYDLEIGLLVKEISKEITSEIGKQIIKEVFSYMQNKDLFNIT